MKFTSTFALSISLFFGSIQCASAAYLQPRSCGSKLTQSEAEAKFKPLGITSRSSGGCTEKIKKTCTSFDGICSGTVQGVINLQKAAGVSSLVVTGGTEVGHASGTYSHSSGHKVDLQHSSTLDAYITKTLTKIGKRGDGFQQWKDAGGNIYADEINHWDVTFY